MNTQLQILGVAMLTLMIRQWADNLELMAARTETDDDFTREQKSIRVGRLTEEARTLREAADILDRIVPSQLSG